MNEQPPPLIRKAIGPNPKHRRDRFRQIWLPFGLFGLVILAGMVLLIVNSAVGTGNEAARWANISLICLIVPVAMVSLALLFVTGGLAVVTTLGINRLPGFFYKIHRFLMRLYNGVKTASDRIAGVATTPSAQKAGWQRLHKMLFRRNTTAG